MKGVLLGAGAAVAGLATFAGWIEPRRLVVRRIGLRLPNWPAALDGLRLGVMSDLHAGAPHAGRKAIAKWVAAMNEAEPEAVVLVGDFLDAHPFFGGRLAPERVAELLAELEAPAVAVLGNHDWTQAGARIWLALERSGIRVLENEAVRLGDPPFHVVGLADLRQRRPHLPRAMADVPEGAPVIVLSHDPDVFPWIPDRVALTVSGHTHGGQVALPVVRRPVIPSRHGERFARGHVVERGRHLYVTSGLGTSGMPVRALAPPELVVLELSGEHQAAPAGRSSAAGS
jgi:predicted MPP superfamily phosphohydrolase